MRWLLVLALASCGRHDIVVVDFGDGGSPQMMGGPPGKRCLTTPDCEHPGDFCEYESCGATAGKCRMRPASCPPNFDPVCGCNGVTYWNDCLRRGAAQPAATSGQCGEPVTCDTGTLCPDSQASCARLLPNLGSSCALTPQGTCWVVPKMCPPVEDTESWESCGGMPVCGGLCSAIRSGQVRRKVDSCP